MLPKFVYSIYPFFTGCRNFGVQSLWSNYSCTNLSRGLTFDFWSLIDQVSPVATSFVEYTVQECTMPPVDEALCVPADAGKGVNT